MAPRIIWNNLLQTLGAVIVPSSEETSLPRSALLRPHQTDVLRFKLGWDIKVAENDGVDFDPGSGEFLATITEAHYDTAALIAANIVTRLNAGGFTSAGCTYSANKFTITDTVNEALNFGSGADFYRSIHPDLGYTSTNKASAMSHLAENVSYQSRRCINIDLGAAQSFTVAAILGHNISGPGIVRLDGHTATMIGIGLLATTPGFTQVLAGGTGLRLAYFASQSKRYLRLVIDDVQNPTGYNELGVLFVGTYLETLGFAPEVIDAREELSSISYAIGGAHHTARRATRKVWELRLHRIDAAKKVELEAFADSVRAGGAFFFDFDGTGANVRYVFLAEGLIFESQETVPLTWNVRVRFLESLG